jgi:hypothetical protein
MQSQTEKVACFYRQMNSPGSLDFRASGSTEAERKIKHQRGEADLKATVPGYLCPRKT